MLAQKNAISAQPPVVLGSKRHKNDLNPVVWLVEVGSKLVSLHALIGFNSAEDDSQDGILIVKVFVLWLQIWIFNTCSLIKPMKTFLLILIMRTNLTFL